MRKLKQLKLHENPYFANVNEALKHVRFDIGRNIDNQRKEFFEAQPIDFKLVDEERINPTG